MRRFTAQSSASVSAALAQSACSVSAVPSLDSASARSAGSVQVGACTPFVIDVIGTSSASKPGQSVAEHAAADLAVQLRDAVRALREPQAHDGHVEGARRRIGAGLDAERERVGRVDAGQQRAR